MVGGCEGPSPLHQPHTATTPTQSLLHTPTELHEAQTTQGMAPRRAGGTSALADDSLVLVALRCWCYSAGGEIVCEKSLEGDAGPRLPCRVAEGEQSHTRRYGASYLLVIEPITWLCFSVAPWTQDSCSLGSTKLDLYEQQAQKTPAALPELVILQIRTQSKPCSCRVTRAGHTGRSRRV